MNTATSKKTCEKCHGQQKSKLYELLPCHHMVYKTCFAKANPVRQAVDVYCPVCEFRVLNEHEEKLVVMCRTGKSPADIAAKFDKYAKRRQLNPTELFHTLYSLRDYKVEALAVHMLETGVYFVENLKRINDGEQTYIWLHSIPGVPTLQTVIFPKQADPFRVQNA